MNNVESNSSRKIDIYACVGFNHNWGSVYSTDDC
jgi:hypothetical protein